MEHYIVDNKGDVSTHADSDMERFPLQIVKENKQINRTRLAHLSDFKKTVIIFLKNTDTFCTSGL